MSDNHFNNAANREDDDPEQTLACARRITRELGNLTAQLRKDNAEIAVMAEELRRRGNRRPLNPESAATIQKIEQLMARQETLRKEIVDAGLTFARELRKWADELEKREQQQAPGLSSSPSIPIVTGGNALMPGEGSARGGMPVNDAVSGASAPVNATPPILNDTGIVLGAVVGTVGDAIADTGIAFVNMAGPEKAPYNPLDSALGYQDAFWKMLGFTSKPFGARTPAENAQLGEAFENAMFALHGDGTFATDVPAIDPRGNYETTILWGVQRIPVRPAGPGFWGPRILQANPEVNAFELQINPNNESYYVPLPDGGYAQFENMVGDTLQDAKHVMDNPSLYHVQSLPEFASIRMLKDAKRQLKAAAPFSLKVQWIISDKTAAKQLQALFRQNNLNITVTFLQPWQP